jgi:phasin family protein
MTSRLNAKNSAIQTAAIDAFMAFSRIYLATTERLAASVLSNARHALDECVTASATANSTDRAAAPLLPLALSKSMLERALAYSRDTYEIVTRGHMEAAQLVTQQFVSRAFLRPDFRVALPPDWSEAFNIFAQGERNLAAMMAATATQKAA